MYTHIHGYFNESGITLIALVITIIVLLILAGVSIAMLTGDNGILNQATDAEKKTTLAEYEEHRRLLEQEAYVGEYDDKKLELTEAEATAQGWAYDQAESITKYDGTDSIIYVPTKIGNTEIKGVNIGSFNKNNTVKKIIFHGNITSINIIGWENLEEVILEEGISKLGGYCFNSCYNLEYIVLPSTLKEINFFGLATTGIRNIVIPKSTTTLGESILGRCKNPITVHCEAESKPEGWNDNWAKNAPEGTTIDWGYKR